MKEALCGADEIHWCTECCPSSCPLLGNVDEGEVGCLGYKGKRSPDDMPRRPNCLKLDCLSGLLPEDREAIRQAISKLPAGRFKMSEVIKENRKGGNNDRGRKEAEG